MTSPKFDFKQFTVWHDACAMKVGTDSVVLGASVALDLIPRNALDIGTGSGILALMLAQRFPELTIHAIEIDQEASKQAANNFANSPWCNRLKISEISLQNFVGLGQGPFDCIVSNPPYYVAKNNFSIESNTRSKARHDGDLSFQDLATGVQELLSQAGQFWLILPVAEAIKFEEEAVQRQLFLTREIQVYPKPGKPIKRLIQAYQKQTSALVRTELFLQNKEGKPSQEYIALSKEFYLHIDL